MSAKVQGNAVVDVQDGVVVTRAQPDTRMQNTITVAIVASVVLFFAGLGLGYLVGKQSVPTRSGYGPMNSRTMPGGYKNGTFDGSRFRDRTSTDDNTNSDDSSSSTQEN